MKRSQLAANQAFVDHGYHDRQSFLRHERHPRLYPVALGLAAGVILALVNLLLHEIAR